ncbi:hypothetical protein [Prescottella agglutinans]|uniref:hypothetical protein n=1 Tax=Prescottella agglutinans TaxID=1644129 RepID=UPI0013E32BE4|nr:hypothetical protein [Prescottella agglutinans]
MIQAVLLTCVPLFVALVGHSAYRVRRANKEHAGKLEGGSAAPGDPAPAPTFREW